MTGGFDDELLDGLAADEPTSHSGRSLPGRLFPPTSERINAVTFDGVNALAREILGAEPSMALVGKDAEQLMKGL